MYEYKVNILKVVDGDTVDVDIDLGFGVWLRNERVRIVGIDTPESRTSDRVEKVFGEAAKQRLVSLLSSEAILRVSFFSILPKGNLRKFNCSWVVAKRK